MSRRQRRRQPAGGSEDGQRWMLTYGDLVTLLMAFFVLLFAMSSIEQEKFQAFLSGLEQFGNPGGEDIGLAVAVDHDVPEPVDPDAPPDLRRLPPDLEELAQELLGAVAAAGHPGALEVHREDRGLAVTFETDRVLFDVGSARITDTGAEIIAAVAPPLAAADNPLLLEGHADTTPLNDRGYTNWNLSTDRAVAVVNVLVERHGLPPQRLTASGFGEFQPRDPGDGPEAKARNRRVELIVVHDPDADAA